MWMTEEMMPKKNATHKNGGKTTKRKTQKQMVRPD